MEEKKLNNDEIDLFEIFQILYKQKFLILTITTIFTLISILISMVMPKTYEAYALFEIQFVTRDNVFLSIICL
uniref:Polysaccharide chain length determinant N-terminal domain-containing protein n=1 Tax=Thermodesulfobacterium geofontis TaxID=1295609 RepID=A0A7C4JRM9_9BACT